MNHKEQAIYDVSRFNSRRQFIKNSLSGLGGMALLSLLGCGTEAIKEMTALGRANALDPLASHFAPRAKRVIFLHMAGAPSQLELFDYKPTLA